MNTPDPLPDEQARRRKGRNRAVMLALIVFALLVYAVTIVKIKLGYSP